MPFPPVAEAMFREEDLSTAQQHLSHVSTLEAEREYAAAQYHQHLYLYHLPTEGIA